MEKAEFILGLATITGLTVIVSILVVRMPKEKTADAFDTIVNATGSAVSSIAENRAC